MRDSDIDSLSADGAQESEAPRTAAGVKLDNLRIGRSGDGPTWDYAITVSATSPDAWEVTTAVAAATGAKPDLLDAVKRYVELDHMPSNDAEVIIHFDGKRFEECDCQEHIRARLAASKGERPSYSHGRPNYHECNVPGCNIQGHKAASKEERP